jgi:hypothetical protein
VALVKEGKVKESLVDDAETYFESKVWTRLVWWSIQILWWKSRTNNCW